MNEKILILINNIGGLYGFRKEVVKAIKDIGYDVYISAPDDDEVSETYFKGIGCHYIKKEYDRRGINPIADLKLLLVYYKMIKQLQPQAVLTYTIKPNVYGGLACRIAGVPLLANITGLGDAVENGGLLQKISLFLYRIGLGKAQCVFFQNKYNKDFCIRHGIATSKTVLLPGSGVNLKEHCFQDYPDDRIIKFLYMGRLMKDKGSDELFETAKTIKSRYPNVEFQILGFMEGDYQEKLNQFVNDGIVIFKGSTTDVRPFLKDVHCTIMPSYHEGMSNANLESASNGRPIITTNIPGCREAVDDSVSGFLVKAKDTHDLINGVEKFLALSYEQKKKMGIEARRKMEREFDRNIVVQAYLREIALL